MIVFDLPWPPSTNNAYAVMRGRKIKTARARQYAQRVANRVAADVDRWGVEPAALKGERLRVFIVAHPPDRRKRDIANLEKLVTDSVFTALGLDDCQIDWLAIARAAVEPAGRLAYHVGVMECVERASAPRNTVSADSRLAGGH